MPQWTASIFQAVSAAETLAGAKWHAKQHPARINGFTRPYFGVIERPVFGILGRKALSNNLIIIIGAVLIAAILLWWLLSLGGVKKKTDSAPKDILPSPAAVLAPPVAPVVQAAVPAAKTAKAKAPVKTAATRKAAAPKTAAPKAAAKPVAEKAKAEKAPKAKAEKVEKAKAEKAPKAQAAKPAPTSSIPDNLELIKGLGPKVNNLLKGLGVTSFAQVANWTAADVADIDAKLGAFAGRITRDNWIDQAQLLAAGDIAGFEQKYGALGSGAKG
jgi:predicted flap endonuclease-1-like 5' DNA nuclease